MELPDEALHFSHGHHYLADLVLAHLRLVLVEGDQRLDQRLSLGFGKRDVEVLRAADSDELVSPGSKRVYLLTFR